MCVTVVNCVLSNHQLYQDLFQESFLRETGDYYQREALKLLEDCQCSEYMEKVGSDLIRHLLELCIIIHC